MERLRWSLPQCGICLRRHPSLCRVTVRATGRGSHLGGPLLSEVTFKVPVTWLAEDKVWSLTSRDSQIKSAQAIGPVLT